MDTDGTVYEGTYVNNHAEGEFTRTRKDGSSAKQYYHKGKYLGEDKEDYKKALESEKAAEKK